jgi:prepilin-type N-terminal cleavage/methylation domain-containing protein
MQLLWINKMKPNQKGFTLIELMVSSLILAVSITGVMSIIGSGRDLEYQNSLRRQATIYASSILEDSLLHYSNYANLGLFPTLSTVFLNPGTANPVPANVTLSLMGGNPQFHEPGFGATPVYFKYTTLTVLLKWNAGAFLDSVSLTKRIVAL